jgi:formiminoglutamase
MIKYYTEEEIAHYISKREGEQKLGEVIEYYNPNPTSFLFQTQKKYAIVGISESDGIALNNGIRGAETTWDIFLKAFLNTQYNTFIKADKMFIYGCISHTENIQTLDDEVQMHISNVLANNWIPIVIGGGHNNAYPILNALSTHKQKPINCINIDPHADLRDIEQRHSGNGFSFAKKYGFLDKYAILGLHQAYNNQFIIDQFTNDDKLFPIWWEEIFLEGKYNWASAIQNGMEFVQDNYFGVELDLDAIENTLSSAMTPVGINTQQACQALYILSMHPNCSYLQLPEGVFERADGLKQTTIGKLLSYLTLSFIKGSI